MSDHDRGAYTPQTDEPLAFDPRRSSARRPPPMTLIGSAIVLFALVGGVALVYRGGVRHAGEGPRPVGEPVLSVKTAPTPGAETTPDGDEEPTSAGVYNQTAAQTATGPTVAQTTPAESTASPAAAPPATAPAAPAPSFAAAPEQPAPRPAPQHPAPPRQSVQTAQAPASPRALAPPHATTGTLDASEVAAAGATIPSAHKAKSAASLQIAEATPAAPSADASTPAGGAVVQIGAFSSSALADKGYAQVAAAMGGQMAGKSKHVLALDHGGATLYRTWVAGFSSRAAADAFCQALKTKNQTCFVKG